MIKIIIMMIWRILPSWSFMKMINVSRQEEHLMHEGDRMATVMGFLSEVSQICCVTQGGFFLLVPPLKSLSVGR